jgi:hypothetical protein
MHVNALDSAARRPAHECIICASPVRGTDRSYSKSSYVTDWIFLPLTPIH